jgi:hypothetical protein
MKKIINSVFLKSSLYFLAILTLLFRFVHIQKAGGNDSLYFTGIDLILGKTGFFGDGSQFYLQSDTGLLVVVSMLVSGFFTSLYPINKMAFFLISITALVGLVFILNRYPLQYATQSTSIYEVSFCASFWFLLLLLGITSCISFLSTDTAHHFPEKEKPTININIITKNKT